MELNSAMRRCHGRDRSGNLQPKPLFHADDSTHIFRDSSRRDGSTPNAPQPSAGTFQNPSTPGQASMLIRFAEPAAWLAGGSSKRKTYIHGRQRVAPVPPSESPTPRQQFYPLARSPSGEKVRRPRRQRAKPPRRWSMDSPGSPSAKLSHELPQRQLPCSLCTTKCTVD